MYRLWLPLLFTVGCGSKSLFVSNSDKERVDVKLTQARIDFDRDELEDAEKYASEAYAINPQSEQAATQLANIYLAQGKLSVIDIATRISTDLKPTDSSSTDSTQATDVLGTLGD